MTDEQIDALEVAAKKMIETSCGPFMSFYNEDFSKVILGLIAALRQARAERDWLVENMPNNVCPEGKTECAERCQTAGGKACYSCVLCWLKAAEEAARQ